MINLTIFQICLEKAKEKQKSHKGFFLQKMEDELAEYGFNLNAGAMHLLSIHYPQCYPFHLPELYRKKD